MVGWIFPTRLKLLDEALERFHISLRLCDQILGSGDCRPSIRVVGLSLRQCITCSIEFDLDGFAGSRLCNIAENSVGVGWSRIERGLGSRVGVPNGRGR